MEKQKNSTLGTLSLIFSVIGCTFFVGIILAIIDLCKKDGKKKTLSIIGLVIGCLWFIIGIAFGDSAGSTEAASSNQEPKIVVEKTDDTASTEIEEEATPEKASSVEKVTEDVKSDEKEAQEETEDEYVKIKSTELIDSFNNNQVKCKNTYDKKKLEVTGIVDSVGTDVLGLVYVCLGHDTEYTLVGIQCYASDEDAEAKIAELSKGDTITVRGKASCGSLALSLHDAEIVD